MLLQTLLHVKFKICDNIDDTNMKINLLSNSILNFKEVNRAYWTQKKKEVGSGIYFT